MRKALFFLLAAVFLCLIPACFYSDVELFEVIPVPGDPPVFSVTTNLDSLHHPQVNDSLELIYNVEIAGGELYFVYAEVAGTPFFESDSTSGFFWIYPEMADSSGVDTLYLDFYYSSNSNSLADRVGYEALMDHLKIAVDFNWGGQK